MKDVLLDVDIVLEVKVKYFGGDPPIEPIRLLAFFLVHVPALQATVELGQLYHGLLTDGWL